MKRGVAGRGNVGSVEAVAMAVAAVACFSCKPRHVHVPTVRLMAGNANLRGPTRSHAREAITVANVLTGICVTQSGRGR